MVLLLVVTNKMSQLCLTKKIVIFLRVPGDNVNKAPPVPASPGFDSSRRGSKKDSSSKKLKVSKSSIRPFHLRVTITEYMFSE